MICNLIKYSGDQITKNEKMEKVCGVHGDRRGAERDLMERPDGKRPLGRHGRGWEGRG